MTIQDIQQAFDARSRVDFSLFLRRVVATTSPGVAYAHNWHIDAIAAYLKACAAGDVRRLIINLPPRMLKSTMVSVAWPAWLLGQDARMRLMVASYAQSLATKHSTDCRFVMQSGWYRRLFPETMLSADQNEKDKFVTTRRGQRLAVSVGGAAIGEGGNILIVDDPLNPLQASHQTQRSAVNQWFDHSFATRLDDKQRGSVLVVMQRLHAEDLSGYLLEKGGWEHLCLPAIAPQVTRVWMGDFRYERAAGEALHPAREPLALLERTKQELGSANFSAQYQQCPIEEAASIIKPHWLLRHRQVPEGTIVQSWDTAVKAGQAHDASACATFLRHEGVHYLLDMLQVRLEYPELKRLMVRHAQRFAPELVLVEDKASGQSLLQDLKRETELPWLAQMPKGDKVSRLVRVSPLFEAGKVSFPHHASWLAELETQLLQFPAGVHDDMVDAISQYLNWVRATAHGGQPMVRRL